MRKRKRKNVIRYILDLRDARAYPLQGRLNQFEASFFVMLRFRKDKSSLLEGVELAARCAGGRQAKCRRFGSEAD